ncbi:molybdate ABC transporter permease subunit [Gorillibacterium sp. sgz5001074]|uniref:molybdate ABC transporter permease subunit n=1 Tax=Gorillibacterium sp. sgz5001074 TaxID=3446695 RepID=UPI003F678D78
MFDATGKEFVQPIWLSLKVAVLSSMGVFLLGLLVSWMMTKRRVRFKTLLETLFLLPLVLPPTVVGFILLVFLGRKSWIGRLAEQVLNHSIIFTWWAAVLASVVVAFPLVYQTLKTGFASVDKELEDSARSLGASELQVFLHITLPLSWRSLIAAFVLGFARGLGEFGATLMVAGNIPGRTQTIPTAIYFAVDAGRMNLAWAWTAATILISFGLLLCTNMLKRNH